MSYKKSCLTIFALLIISTGRTQCLQGSISDENGQALENVLLYCSQPYQESFSNARGNFHICMDTAGSYLFRFFKEGFEQVSVLYQLKAKDTLLCQLTLKKKLLQLSTVTVEAERVNQRNTVSDISISGQTLSRSHGLMEDPLRVLSTMPGIARGGDLFSPTQLYVRGGAPEENLYMLNNARIYFPFYFGGQKSVFNSDVIENVELLTGGFSAKYGNALSSVLNVNNRDGHRDHFSGNASIGFYNSQFLAEGPAGKKFSYLLAARRTYLDLFLDESAEFPVPEFGDFNYRLSYFVHKNHQISLTGLLGYEWMNFLAPKPEPGLPDKIKTNGRNNNESLQWTYFRKKLYSKLSLTHTRQNNAVSVGPKLALNINGHELGMREDAVWYMHSSLKLLLGGEINYTLLDFNSQLPLDPRDTDPTDTTVKYQRIVFNDRNWWAGTYASANWEINKRLGLSSGIRFDHNQRNQGLDVSPRFSAYYQVSTKTELRVAYTIHHQFAEPNAINQNKQIQSGRCIHHIVGVKHRFSAKLSGWAEAYYKQYSRLLSYDTLMQYNDNGSGHCSGVETFLKYQQGSCSAWASYALSIARRKSNIDQAAYYFEYDQRHIANLVLQYSLKTKWKILPTFLSLNLRYESGRPYTPVLSAVQGPSGWAPVKGPINSQRNPYYLNINFRIEWNYYRKGRFSITSFMEIWNLLNRKNLLGRSYQYGSQFPGNVFTQPYYSTTLLPAGGVKFTF